MASRLNALKTERVKYCFFFSALPDFAWLLWRITIAHKELVQAVAYLRTSSAANTAAGKGSGKRQRAAIEAFAKSAGFLLVGEYYDEAVSGADHVTARPGFAAMMDRIAAIVSGPSSSRPPTASPVT